VEIAVKSILVALIVTAAALFGSPSQADDRDVTVVNGTGYSIKFLGFNNPGDNDWSENELDEVLRNGDSVDVEFDTDDQGCKWNIRVDWADEGYPGVIWKNVDLCSISTITLHYDRRTDTTSITTK
jgi:hypothetical protein